jgi:hypothetical protein
MPYTEPILAVIPILGYANPQSGQPANGRLMAEHRQEGLVLTDPKSAATSPVVMKTFGVVLMLVGSIIAIADAIPPHWDFQGELLRAGTAVLGLLCGLFCFFKSSKMKQDPRVVRLADGRVYTTGCPGHDWMSGRFPVRRFILLKGSVELRSLQSVYSIRVRYRFKFTITLIPLLSRDEAVWAIELLDKALAGNAI